MELNKHILEYLSEIVEKHGENIAVEEEGRIIYTYQQLWEAATSISNFIRYTSSGSEIIALNMEKSGYYIASLLGTWMAGKYFLPIGTDIPESRKQYILNKTKTDLILTSESVKEILGNFQKYKSSHMVLSNNGYVIFSSGTTGKPKGIVVGQKGIVNLAHNQSLFFNVTSKSRFFWFLSLNFDASVSDILVTLFQGATLVIGKSSDENLIYNLPEILKKNKITHTDLPPSLLNLINVQKCPSELQAIVIGGEAANFKCVRSWAKKINLYNVYGPTEATVCTSMCRCDQNWNHALIGKPLENIHYYIFNNGNLDSSQGELWISGVGLAEGYLDDEVLTDKKFPVIDGVRYYRTGDKVRRLPSGEIEILGRIDRQVKSNGHLIELEEIESIISNLNFVKRCGVVAIKKKTNKHIKTIIVAYVALKDGNKQGHEIAIKQFLKNHLPDWMMPNKLRIIESLPETASGKINYPLLERLYKEKGPAPEELRYSNEKSRQIAEEMAKILKRKGFKETSNFLSEGGDSLDSLLLISRLSSKGIFITESQLIRNSTPLSLSLLSEEIDNKISYKDLSSKWKEKIKLPKKPPYKSKHNNILITGATGFLGSHILFEILNSKKYSGNVYCVVRCNNSDHGKKRLVNTFKRYDLSPEMLDKVNVISGDITLPELGLDETTYNNLIHNAQIVFHCAAKVNMAADYNNLENTNIESLRNIISFCMEGCYKKLNYASTLSVFVGTDLSCKYAKETEIPEGDYNIYGGYAQTKLVAEKICYQIPDSYCGLNIFRFGLLTGSQKNGIAPEHDFFSNFLQNALKYGKLPNINKEKINTASLLYDMGIDITPVDLASKIMLEIAESSDKGIYHIAAEKPLSYEHLLDLLVSSAKIDLVKDYQEWERDLALSGNDYLKFALCRFDQRNFSKLRHLDLFQTTMIRFDQSKRKLYSKIECGWNDNLIKKYLRNI